MDVRMPMMDGLAAARINALTEIETSIGELKGIGPEMLC